jgi:predicted transcriptional regulator
MPLSEFMNPVISIRSNQSILKAIQLMNFKHLRRLIVIDANDKMVEIITEKDIFSRIAKDPRMTRFCSTTRVTGPVRSKLLIISNYYLR